MINLGQASHYATTSIEKKKDRELCGGTRAPSRRGK
jgi:hypothetical protein